MPKMKAENPCTSRTLKILGDVSEDEVVLAFLRSEINSSRFKDLYLEKLQRDNRDLGVITDADLGSREQNSYRLALLGEIRGYKEDQSGFDSLPQGERWEKLSLTFDGFPEDVSWKRALLGKADILGVRSINDAYWLGLTGGTRRFADAARNIREGKTAFGIPNDTFWQIAEAIRRGERFPGFIMASAGPDSALVAIEGNARLTAYMLVPESLPERLEVLVGFSGRMGEWRNY